MIEVSRPIAERQFEQATLFQLEIAVETEQLELPQASPTKRAGIFVDTETAIPAQSLMSAQGQKEATAEPEPEPEPESPRATVGTVRPQAVNPTSEKENEPKRKRANEAATCVPIPEGYATYSFHRYKPAENSYREYQVSYQPSLWEPHAGQRVWGRRGNKKRLLDQRFETQEEALDWLQKMVERRLKRGYVLTWYSSASASASA
jgi:predicted DNA-binding WGR domain protein